MSEVIPFEKHLPAHLAALGGVSEDDLIAGAAAGFPVISIKGKVFHIGRGEDRQLVTASDGESPAPSIEVVILKANPHLSKTYYKTGYEEGSQDKPTCYSNNGVVPEEDSAEKQAVRCVTCPHNQWGSRTTDSGVKAKACSDVRRLAVAPIGQVNDPMLLRIPPASLKTLAQYGDALKKRGVKYPMLITKISFDFALSHPALTFKPVGFLSEDMAKQVAEVIKSDVVQQILGTNESHAAVAGPAPVATAPVVPVEQAKVPAIAAPKPAPTQKAPAKKTSNVFAQVAEAEVAGPKATVQVEGAEPQAAPAPAPKAVKAVPQVKEVNVGELDNELDKLLGNFDG